MEGKLRGNRCLEKVVFFIRPHSNPLDFTDVPCPLTIERPYYKTSLFFLRVVIALQLACSLQRRCVYVCESLPSFLGHSMFISSYLVMAYSAREKKNYQAFEPTGRVAVCVVFHCRQGVSAVPRFELHICVFGGCMFLALLRWAGV
jgi:hypothetical protein